MRGARQVGSHSYKRFLRVVVVASVYRYAEYLETQSALAADGVDRKVLARAVLPQKAQT